MNSQQDFRKKRNLTVKDHAENKMSFCKIFVVFKIIFTEQVAAGSDLKGKGRKVLYYCVVVVAVQVEVYDDIMMTSQMHSCLRRLYMIYK